MTVQAVIFDIGNVLIEWQPERWYDATYGRETREKLFAEVDLHGMNDAIDHGADFHQSVQACANAYPHWAEHIMAWHAHWLDLATPEIPHSVRLLKALQAKKVPVFALTNFGIGTWEIATPVYPFLKTFDRAYVSGHMGVIKPNAQIYQMVEDDCGLSGDALIFTDDRADNIAAASSRGWKTHRFEGPQGWADRLVAEGLLTEAEAQ
jgi:2-haloacid dehalogenase